MAGVAGWGTRKTLEEMQARAREMYGPFRDETRVDPITGLSYQFSDIRPGQDRTDPVWLTPEQNEATRAYFADGGRIGDDGIIQKDVTKPAFTQNQDGSYSSGSTTTTVTAPNVGTAWGYTGKPGIFTKAWQSVTGDDFPDQVRAKTPWTQAYVNTIDPFLPWNPSDPNEGARIPPAISTLVTEPARLAEKGVKGQEFNPADNAALAMTLFAAGGIGKGLASGQQSGILGRAGSRLGLEDPLLTTPETTVPSLMQNYRDATRPVLSAGDEKAVFLNPSRGLDFSGLNEAIIEKAKAGKPIDVIADEIGVSTSALRKHLARNEGAFAARDVNVRPGRGASIIPRYDPDKVKAYLDAGGAYLPDAGSEVTRHAISKFIKDNPEYSRAATPNASETVNKAVDLAKSGWSYSEIGQEIGKSRNAVAGILTRARNNGLFAAGDERAALMAGAFQQESSNPTVRAAHKRAAGVPFEDRLAVQHNMRGRSFEHNVNSYGGNIPVPSLALSKAGNPLTNFGDISLFGAPDMAIPKGSNPVYPGDAYTARAPRLVRDVPKSADRDRLYEKLTGEKGQGYRLNLDDPFWDPAFRAGFLRSQGLERPPGMDLDDWSRSAIGYGQRDAVERFVSDFLDSHKGVIRERIDKGWSSDGERRLYAPHTLENMVKASKGKAGSEDFNYGPMAWKAATMSPFRSLADIQENRGLIRTEEKAALEAQKDQLSAMGFKLAEALGYRDTHPDMILEGLRSSDPEIRAMAQELRAALKSLPTEYFEAKPQRAVDMGEFEAAAVPEGMNDAADYLTRRGLDVRRIPEGEDARKAALTEILRSRPDLLFEGGDPKAAFAPAQDEDERPSEAEGLMSRLMRLWGDK